jgi:hypothetical protein
MPCHAELAGNRKTADYTGLHPAGSDSMRAIRIKPHYFSNPQTQRQFSHSIQSSPIGDRHINCIAYFFPMSDQS